MIPHPPQRTRKGGAPGYSAGIVAHRIGEFHVSVQETDVTLGTRRQKRAMLKREFRQASRRVPGRLTQVSSTRWEDHYRDS